MTYIRTWEGWAYLATVIDLASRRVVGWALADNMETDLVSTALRMAIAERRPAPGLIFHSAQRGSQLHLGRFPGAAGRARHRPVPLPPGPVLGQRCGRIVVRRLQE